MARIEEKATIVKVLVRGEIEEGRAVLDVQPRLGICILTQLLGRGEPPQFSSAIRESPWLTFREFPVCWPAAYAAQRDWFVIGIRPVEIWNRGARGLCEYASHTPYG